MAAQLPEPKNGDGVPNQRPTFRRRQARIRMTAQLAKLVAAELHRLQQQPPERFIPTTILLTKQVQQQRTGGPAPPARCMVMKG